MVNLCIYKARTTANCHNMHPILTIKSCNLLRKNLLASRDKWNWNVDRFRNWHCFAPCTLAPSDAPSNLTVIAINSTSVYFSWLPPDEDQHNGDIRHYNIRILDLLSGREVQLNSTNTMSIHSDLHPAYTYRFTVAAVTVGIGPYSDPAITTMPEDGMHTLVN